MSSTCGRIHPIAGEGKNVNSGKSNNEMFFECCKGLFCGIDTTVIWGGMMDVNLLGTDMLFDCGGTFVVHHVQCWPVTS